MKKLLLLAVIAFSNSMAFSQMVVSGGDFANHPERYDNKPVSINQVTVGGSDEGHGHHAGPGAHHGAPGAGGHQAPCNPPRGAQEVKVNFMQNPDFHGCFYAQGPMATQIMNKARGPQPVEMVLSFKGNRQIGYLITAYKVGH